MQKGWPATADASASPCLRDSFAPYSTSIPIKMPPITRLSAIDRTQAPLTRERPFSRNPANCLVKVL